MTDQEGGPVAKLTPPLPRPPPLKEWAAQFTRDPEAARIELRKQAMALVDLGVNVNLAPVVDLAPGDPAAFYDRNSFIAQRAISSDPAEVSRIGQAYCTTMVESGVIPTVKHFPGLGRVRADTHHFGFTLETPQADLEAADWKPFREIATRTQSWIMLSHVVLGSADRTHPASCSGKVADGILRQNWGFDGIIITDDFTMTPVRHHPAGVENLARDALTGGVDLILVAFDPDLTADILAALLRNPPPPFALEKSDRRLLEATLRNRLPGTSASGHSD